LYIKITPSKNKNQQSGKHLKSGDTKTEKTSIDKMSLAGVGNSAFGNLAVNLVEKLLTAEENKPATKKDIQSNTNKLKRYHLVKNMRPNFNGELAYFDVERRMVVYLNF
jgi:hypothetical protein